MVAPNQIFNDALLQMFRDIEERTRPGLCSIIFPVAESASNTGQSGAPNENSDQQDVIFGNVQCRVSPFRMGQETESSVTLQSIARFWISLPWDIETQAGHRVTEDCSILFEGTTYRIVDVKAPRTFRTKTRCLCEKVR